MHILMLCPVVGVRVLMLCPVVGVRVLMLCPVVGVRVLMLCPVVGVRVLMLCPVVGVRVLMLCPVVGVRVLMLCPVVGVRVLQTEELRRQGMEGRGVGDILTDFPVWVTVDTVSPPCHLALSSDDLTLSVCITRPSGVFALMFDTRAFARQVCIQP